jgi:hypothetical protein
MALPVRDSIVRRAQQFYFAIVQRKPRTPEISSMASRAAAQSIEMHRPPSADDLRHAFELAVCEIHRADTASMKCAPIVSRAKLLGLSREKAEKRALSDAARALAQLWKV